MYICIKCGATAVKKLVNLKRQCDLPTPALAYSLQAYAKGEAPKGFPGWPYTRLQADHKVIMKNVQSQVDLVWKTYQPELMRQDGSSSDMDDEVACNQSSLSASDSSSSD